MPDDYYLHHADAYDRSSPGVAGDVEFYRALAVEAGGPVVELGAGTGRVAIPVAQAGIEVVAIDNAAPMLAIARRKAIEAGVAHLVHPVLGDMRAFSVRERVPLVLIPYRSFLHNLEVEDQVATLAACRQALRPGGVLAFNVFNPALRIVDGWTGLSPEEWDSRGAPESVTAAPLVVRSTLRVRGDDGVRRDARIALRYVSREEMESLLDRSGFAVEALYGDFERTPFTRTSTEMVWIARRT